MKIKVGLIGFGRMGRFYLKEMQKSGRWEVAYICDINPDCRELAKKLSPESKILENEQEMFDDESVQVVGLFALADSRKDRIEKAIKYGKHIISEKPVSDTIDKEWEVVDITEKAACFSTVNLYLRNAWYHQAIKQFIDRGEIGEL
ncbi:Gfo/Idh/MocA family protein, partial [Bacteroides faecis]